MSVKLLGRKPMCEIRSLALDEGSRTSSVLARVLLFQHFGLFPQLESLPVDADLCRCNADAILLIGDRAIDPPTQDFVEIWDLGDRWWRYKRPS